MERRRRKIDITQYPLLEGEKWWIVHPNDSGAVFDLPEGAAAVTCAKDRKHQASQARTYGFRRGHAYLVTEVDHSRGWVCIDNGSDTIEMPFYLFSRWFDATAFMRPRNEPSPNEIREQAMKSYVEFVNYCRSLPNTTSDSKTTLKTTPTKSGHQEGE